MQAAKIKIDNTLYAVRDEKNVLVMFRPVAITTRRTGMHSSDFTHKIEGYILNDDRTPRGALITFAPDKILGEYTEHHELVRRKDAADAEAKRIKEKKLARQERLIHELYKLVGLSEPVELKDRRAPIHPGYGDDINIDCDVVERIFAGLKRPALKVVS